MKTSDDVLADLGAAIAAYREVEKDYGTQPQLTVMLRLHEVGAVVTDLAEQLRNELAAEAGWTRTEDELPNRQPRTLIKLADHAKQKRLMALNIGRH